MSKTYKRDRCRSSFAIPGLLAIILISGLAVPVGVAMADDTPATTTDEAIAELEKAVGKLEIQSALNLLVVEDTI